MSPPFCMRVDTGLAPDGVYIHIVTSSGVTLATAPITDLSASLITPLARVDADLVDEHLRAHPKEAVFTQVYDGDTGELLSVAVSLTPKRMRNE